MVFRLDVWPDPESCDLIIFCRLYLELKNRWLSYSRAAVNVNIMKLRLRNYKISLVLDVILGDITLVNRLSRFRACSENIKSGSATSARKY
jgi:hypothetical protein